MVEQDIDLAVKGTITHEMMIGGMVKRNSGKEETGAEVREETVSSQVVLIAVCISTDKVGGVWVQGTYLFNMFLQPCKSSNKLLFFSSSWEINDSMEGSNCRWEFKKDS